MEYNIINIFDLAGTFAFAVSGTITAMQKRFDPFGALFIGFITAIGGGSIRDISLGNTPVSWMINIDYFIVIVAAILFTILFQQFVARLKTTLFLFDTIGIGVFTVIGLEKALAVGIPAPMAILMGVSSAVVGGVMRDVVCNEIPLVFHKEIYATACLLGGMIYIMLSWFKIPNPIIIPVTIGFIISIRLLSVKLNWALPPLSSESERA